MFLFYHSSQDEKNISYYKGLLFEELLKAYLEQSGYKVELRKKHNSLEYDIEGKLKATNQTIIGEAKAHSKNMSGQTLSAFVGKLLPLGLTEKKIHGLFLSLSPLTPEADEYYSSIKSMGVTSKTGHKLYQEISNTLGLPNDDTLQSMALSAKYDVVVSNILKTDTGIFKLLILKNTKSGTPSSFAIFNSNGDEINDQPYINLIRNNISELSGLEFINISNQSAQKNTEVVNREISYGLSLGTDWADYRLPASPQVFVGRKQFIENVELHIKSSDIPHVIQIKSRSGVGKSSVISFLENKLSGLGFSTELHDSRDVKTIYDVFSLIARFVKSHRIPTNYIEVDNLLFDFSDKLDKQKGIFFVDQFESTFSTPEIFECYEYIAKTITNINGGIYIVFARKNDQLTTYDDSRVSLSRINSLSKNYVLPDFEKDESIHLLNKINENTNNTLSREILPYVIEFSQGFPWLLKRTISHVLKLTSQGESQRELIGAGLKLNDLFEEELEGLDEIEKGYLTRIASKLPADFKELQYQFDEDPILAKVLDKLTELRLVRLSGATYDTYNDVFKEYLVYQKLPEFRQLIIYRLSPGSVIKPFHKMINMKKISIESITKEIDVSEGYAFNLVKELRNLDLLQGAKGKWIIPTNVKDIYAQGQLAVFLRKKLMDNELVEKLISSSLSDNHIKNNDLPNYFSSIYHFIDASEKTWVMYSTTLRAWLLTLHIMEIDKSDRLVATKITPAEISTQLGNLNQISFQSRNKGLFSPMTSYIKMREVTKLLLEEKEPLNKEGDKAKVDLKNAGVLIGTKLAVTNIEELDDALTGQLLNESYSELWNAIKLNEPCYDIFKTIIGKNLAKSTIQWKLRKLTALAKKLEVIPNKRFRY